MGFGKRLETEQGNRCKEIKLEGHRPLSLMMGRRRSSERRDNTTRPILLPSGDPVVAPARKAAQFRITISMELDLGGKGVGRGTDFA